MAKQKSVRKSALSKAERLKTAFTALPGPHSRWFCVDVWVNKRWENNLTTTDLENAFEHCLEFRCRYPAVRVLDQFGKILALLAGIEPEGSPPVTQIATLNNVEAHVTALLVNLEQEEENP